MNNDVTREEFEQAIDEIMGEWFIILSYFDSSGFGRTLSCRAESGKALQYMVEKRMEEPRYFYDSIEALEFYNSIRG